MDKIKLLIALILVILPILSFTLQYYFSKKAGTLKALRKHGMVFYSDWIFLIFNPLLFYAIPIPSLQNLILFSLFSILVNIWLHFNLWLNVHIKEKKKAHMYDLINKKLSNAGIVHFLFSVVQLTLMLIFLFSPITNSLYFYEAAILCLFFLSIIPSSLRIHDGKLLKSDLFGSIFGVFCILIKLLLQTL